MMDGDYDILEEAEHYAFWSSLNREEFANLMERCEPIRVGGKEAKLSDFFDPEELKKIWDDSSEHVEPWAREKLSRAHLNGYITWMAIGMVFGYIKGLRAQVR